MPVQTQSHTSMVNAALAELGSTETITSFDDSQSKSAQRARSLFPGILDDALYAHPWNFAIRRVTLNASGDAPAFGPARAFLLPNDCIRWLPDGNAARRNVEREGRHLVSDNPAPLPCRYIARVNDPSAWSPGFYRLMVLELATAMAEGVTQSQSIKDRLLERAERQRGRAKRMDGLESGSRRREQTQARSTWLSGRRLPNSHVGR
jgi:hypothetical protein